MSVIDQFPGCEIVCGNIIHNRVRVGYLKDEQQYFTEEGRALLDSTVDAQTIVIEVTDAATGKSGPGKAGRRKAAAEPDVSDVDVGDIS